MATSYTHHVHLAAPSPIITTLAIYMSYIRSSGRSSCRCFLHALLLGIEAAKDCLHVNAEYQLQCSSPIVDSPRSS